MKYIYYIVAIVILFSGLAAYGLFDTQIEVSKPVLSVNDRIFSEAELSMLLEHEPSDVTRDQFIESLIEKQLLIQEGIKQKINKEESFRRSVQNFYEQSLIKILLDRKFDSIVVDVTTEEVSRYKDLVKMKVKLAKQMYPSLSDVQNRQNETIETIQTEFISLSDDLKFIVLNLKQDEESSPRNKENGGVVIYRLEEVLPIEMENIVYENAFDVKKVSLFIQDKKKEAFVNEWISGMRNAAEIWRK